MAEKLIKPERINEDYWNKLSETGKANLLKSMLNIDNDEIETNKYGRWQLKRFAEDIANYKNYHLIKNNIQNNEGYIAGANKIRPTCLTGWDFLVREYTSELPETVEDFNMNYENMITSMLN